jgi:small subunit ribosomal protein S1
VVRGRVVEVVKGGLVLDVGVRAFLPASLVEMRRVRDLNPYVGRELEAKVLEMDRGRGNLVLSRRARLEETRSAGRSTLLAQLQPGQIRRGIISSVVNFGAFVDLGGVDGLISVAELSWTHHNHPSDVVDVGQEVEVEVLDVDQARGRISLSLKATQQDPWPQFARNHPIGQIVPGRVTKLMPFGAFIRVDGLEGLVHVSELADHRVDTPDQVLRAGQGVLVKVTDIDLQRRRISLSVRQANAEYLPDEEQFDPVTYGMLNTYDADGNYIYPEGFDAASGEWLPGFEEQRDAWERQYAEAHDRWVALGQQVEAARTGAPAYSSGPPSGSSGPPSGQRGGGGRGRGGNDRSASHGSGQSNAPRATKETTGNEDIDERLAALRERLSEGRNGSQRDS